MQTRRSNARRRRAARRRAKCRHASVGVQVSACRCQRAGFVRTNRCLACVAWRAAAPSHTHVGTIDGDVQPPRAVEVGKDRMDSRRLPDSPEGAVVVHLYHATRAVVGLRPSVVERILVDIQHVGVPRCPIGVIRPDVLSDCRRCGAPESGFDGVLDHQVSLAFPECVLRLSQHRERPVAWCGRPHHGLRAHTTGGHEP